MLLGKKRDNLGYHMLQEQQQQITPDNTQMSPVDIRVSVCQSVRCCKWAQTPTSTTIKPCLIYWVIGTSISSSIFLTKPKSTFGWRGTAGERCVSSFGCIRTCQWQTVDLCCSMVVDVPLSRWPLLVPSPYEVGASIVQRKATGPLLSGLHPHSSDYGWLARAPQLQ